MAHLAQVASARSHASTTTATAIVGAALIAYRINGRADQRAELYGLVKMARALGALEADECDRLLSLLDGREVAHA